MTFMLRCGALTFYFTIFLLLLEDSLKLRYGQIHCIFLTYFFLMHGIKLIWMTYFAAFRIDHKLLCIMKVKT